MATDVPRHVIQKLMFFTAAMVALPLITFFTVQQLTSNTIISGGIAAATANFVLIWYIVVAFMEEGTPDEKAEAKKKD